MIDLIFITIQTFLWSTILYTLTQPRFDTMSYFAFYLAHAFACSGVGYVLSTCLNPRTVTIYTALLMALGAMLLSGTQIIILKDMLKASLQYGTGIGGTGVPTFLMSMTPTRWICEAMSVSDARYYDYCWWCSCCY